MYEYNASLILEISTRLGAWITDKLLQTQLIRMTCKMFIISQFLSLIILMLIYIILFRYED